MIPPFADNVSGSTEFFLAILSIESQRLDDVNTDNIIDTFADIKARVRNHSRIEQWRYSLNPSI